MTASGGSVKATLELDIKNFEANLKKAQQSVEQMGSRSANSLNKLDTSLQKSTSSAKDISKSVAEARASTAAYTGALQTNYKAIADWITCLKITIVTLQKQHMKTVLF